MKSAPRIAAVALLALISVTGAGMAGIAGVKHLTHTGDIRALHLTGRTLWIATGGGLFRYDTGSDQFTAHLTVDDALPSNSVRAVNSDGDRVYVGTDAGLVVYNGDDATVYTDRSPGAHDSLTFDDIRAIDFGRDETTYLCTYGHGLGVMTPDGGTMITRADSLLDNKVYGVVEQWGENEDGIEEGSWYYATSMGLCAYRDSAWVGFQAGAGIPRGEVRRLFARDNAYYLLVGVGGVYRFNGYRATDISPRGVLPGDDIADMVLDDRGVIWAAGRRGGLAVYQGGNWTRIGQGKPKIDDARWRCAYAAGDDAGVFFGSADGRVAVVRDNVLRTFDVPAELPSGRVRGLVRAADGVYCLSGPSVVHIDSSVTTVTVDDSPPGTDAIAVDAGGELWTVGRWGIHQRHGGSYTEFRHDVSAVEPAFTAVVFDPANRMWTAVRTGSVFRYDGELWVKMGEPEEVLGGPVDGLRAGDAGTVWAFSGAGVARFDGREWKTFPADSLGGAVVDLALGPAGAVVAATRARLWLFREDSAGWQPVSVAGTADVRPFLAPRSRAINRVVFDADGHMYLGTDAGLALVGPGGVRWLGVGDGIGGGAVIDLLVEKDRALWVGFRSDGVARIPWKSLW